MRRYLTQRIHEIGEDVAENGKQDWFRGAWGESDVSEEMHAVGFVGVPTGLTRRLGQIGWTVQEYAYAIIYADVRRSHPAEPPKVAEVAACAGLSVRTVQKYHRSLILKGAVVPTRLQHGQFLDFTPTWMALLALEAGIVSPFAAPARTGPQQGPELVESREEAQPYKEWYARVPSTGYQEYPLQGTLEARVPSTGYSPEEPDTARVPSTGYQEYPLQGTLSPSKGYSESLEGASLLGSRASLEYRVQRESTTTPNGVVVEEMLRPLPEPIRKAAETLIGPEGPEWWTSKVNPRKTVQVLQRSQSQYSWIDLTAFACKFVDLYPDGVDVQGAAITNPLVKWWARLQQEVEMKERTGSNGKPARGRSGVRPGTHSRVSDIERSEQRRRERMAAAGGGAAGEGAGPGGGGGAEGSR